MMLEQENVENKNQAARIRNSICPEVGAGAMRLLGWEKCWAIIWYNSEADF